MAFDSSRPGGVQASAKYGEAVTPSDATVINCRALWVGTGGNVSIKHTGGESAVVYNSVPGGSILPVQIVNGRVMAATTASNIVAMDW